MLISGNSFNIKSHPNVARPPTVLVHLQEIMCLGQKLHGLILTVALYMFNWKHLQHGIGLKNTYV